MPIDKRVSSAAEAVRDVRDGGTELTRGKEVRRFEGRDHVLERNSLTGARGPDNQKSRITDR